MLKNNEIYREIGSIHELLEVEKETGKTFKELFCIVPEYGYHPNYIERLKVELKKWLNPEIGDVIIYYKKTKHCLVSIGYAQSFILQDPHFYLAMFYVKPKFI